MTIEPTTLHTIELQAERKKLMLTLGENHQGRFLRITEDVNGRRDTIMVPEAGITALRDALIEMAGLAMRN